jgi:RNA polymerase sigma-70 factor (ECF subfamily)
MSDKPQAEDRELMLEYAAGDLHAFDALFERWAPRLHAFFHRSFGCAADADDLLQRTFMRVHPARRSYDAERPLRPWLFTIAARLRQDELRRRRRLASADEELLAASDEEWRDPAIEMEAQRVSLVQAALQRLPESQRTVIHLHRYERMTFAEIAAALGTTEGAVKLRAFRAYQRLRVLLAPLVSKDDVA